MARRKTSEIVAEALANAKNETTPTHLSELRLHLIQLAHVPGGDPNKTLDHVRMFEQYIAGNSQEPAKQ